MAYTDLTGENFRVAHQALMQRGEGGAVSAHRSAKQTKVLEIICVVVGILLGALLLAGAAKCGMARGAAWECGDYASQPAWND
jgi:hypothetical protein